MLNKLHLWWLLGLLACSPSPHPPTGADGLPLRGTVQESRTMQSKILDRVVQYSVYLPPGYDTSQESYPILYLLHGYTDDETAWIQKGAIDQSADQGIAAGTVTPMIIVMPDGGVTFFVDDYRGREKYQTMFMQELMPYIEQRYRVRAEAKYRAVAGLSMGGYGAAVYAMHHPELFTTCVALSGAFRTDTDMAGMKPKRYHRVFNQLYGEGEGTERLTRHWHNHSPNYLARHLPEDQLRRVRWYIDCGDDDALSPGNAALHIIFKERDVPHEYRVRNGNHNWHYWRTGMVEGLKFISESFRR